VLVVCRDGEQIELIESALSFEVASDERCENGLA